MHHFNTRKFNAFSQKIIVDAIFLETTDQANEDLRYLSIESSGDWYAAASIEDMQFLFNQISFSEVTHKNSYQVAFSGLSPISFVSNLIDMFSFTQTY